VPDHLNSPWDTGMAMYSKSCSMKLQSRSDSHSTGSHPAIRNSGVPIRHIRHRGSGPNRDASTESRTHALPDTFSGSRGWNVGRALWRRKSVDGVQQNADKCACFRDNDGATADCAG
jgi:hypothetical protein